MTLKTQSTRKFGKISRIGSFWPDKRKREEKLPIVPRAIFYSKEAQEVLGQNPGLLKKLLEASRRIELQKRVIIGDLEVTNVSEQFHGHTATQYYLARISGKKYLIKETQRTRVGIQFSPTYDAPHAQVVALQKAEELLRQNKEFDRVTVAKPVFALNRRDTLYLATEYHAGFTIAEIEKNPELQARFPQVMLARPMIKRMNEYLEAHGIVDAIANNLLWSPLLNKFVIVDVRAE
jgi:hypothetical protein